MKLLFGKWLPGVAIALALTQSAGAADLRPFDRGSWSELRQEHAGRPVIVHFWGLTCTPCLVELAEWGRFAHQADGVSVVTIAADSVTVDPADLTRMLAKAGLADGEAWRFANAFSERLQFEVDPTWQGELPFTVLLARNGTATSVLGTADFPALRAWADTQTTVASKALH